MTDLFTSKDKAFKALGKTLLCALCVFVAGAINAPRVRAADMPQVPELGAASADQPVPIDQQPLTVAAPLPPNIVLMLDDSGSMAWDVMPDWGNLSSTDDLAVIDSSVNGVYYNPGATYTPPPKANSTSSWPDADFDSAAVNGFYTGDERHEVDLTTYDGDYDSSTSTGFSDGYPTGSSNLQYSVSIAQGAYDAPDNCPNGTNDSGTQDEYCYYSHDPSPKFHEFYDDVSDGTWYVSKCNTNGIIYNKDTNKCIDQNNVVIADDNGWWSCPDGSTSIGETTVDYDDNREICVTNTYHFFTYATGGVRHYVGKSGICAAAGLSATVCVDPSQATPTDPTVQAGMSGADVLQNVANWFSYYHTRMLMAKSSLMNAFSGLNKDYRFGFGSLHNNGGFPDGLTTTSYSGHKIAEVEPFGDGSATSDQKSKFWSWILDTYPHNGTPLRTSLKAIGQYYQSAQPWQTSDTDTTKLACRQSYAILTTDGFWNGDSPSLGNVDNEDGPDVTVPDSDDKQTYSPALPFKDDESNTLADVAMYYWNHDLQSGISNEVPVSGKADPAFWQHMTTFTIGMGYKPVSKTCTEYWGGRCRSYETKELDVTKIFDWAQGGDAIADFSWPTPDDDSINNIADMLHAAVNGHGGFYSATSPQAFTEGLQNALKRIAARKGSGASLSASSATLGTDTYIYQVLYHTGDWSGSLYAYNLDENGNPTTAPPAWSAEEQMPDWDQRNIHTSAGGEDVEFKYDNLSGAEKSALGDTTVRQQRMVKYLRGKLPDVQEWGDDWRARLTLGDIVGSQPIYVAAPDPDLYSDSRMDFSGSSGYKSFADNKKDVAPILYVAANDGMLHGFDATLKETYAYLPAAVILHGSETGDHHISQIADPNYGYQNGGVPHQYFNDGQLTVADVYMGGGWKVVLVGTTGRGHAKAVYALDVTDPANVSLMWEKSAYTADCDECAYIGQMTSKPIIAQVADGQWAVLIGNGYNSEKNQAALLQFSLSDGTLNVHTAGTAGDNGLSGPAIWIADSTNNISTVAYAGDLDGHVWSFPLNNNGTATPTTTGTTLFTAEDAAGNAQPITAALAVQQDAATGKRWVFFGTGQYLSSADVDNVSSNETWYGLIVNDEDGNEVVAGTRNNLVEREIVGEGTDSNDNRARSISEASEVDAIGDNDGWYIDLTDMGERMVVANQFHGHLLYGTSIMPSATDPCDPSGSGWVMAINPFTGTNPEWAIFGSTLTTGPDDDQVTRNTSGVYFGSMPNAPIFLSGSSLDEPSRMLTSDASGGVTKQDLTPPAGAGRSSARISWREVISD